MNEIQFVMCECYDAFFRTLEHHFRHRGIILNRNAHDAAGKRTRTRQYFTMELCWHTTETCIIQGASNKLLLECWYNTVGDVTLYVKLDKLDEFKGAADFNMKDGKMRYHIHDIIRSFSDYSTRETLAVISIF